MGRLVAAVAVVASAVAQAPAHAAPGVQVSYTHCTEVTALAPAAGHRPAVAVVTFSCRAASINGRAVGPAAVSEVVALQPDGTAVLLRTTTDNGAVHLALTRVGLPSVLAERISIVAVRPSIPAAPGAHVPLAAERVEVTSGGRSSRIDAGTVRVGLRDEKALDGDGLTHRYDGPRGQVTTQYRNTLSGPGGAAGGGAGAIDATADDQLARWLGASLAGASVIAVDGDWTADVERRR